MMNTDNSKLHLKARKYGQHGNCPKCYGIGYIHGFKHVMNGVCFECSGSGDSKRNYSKAYTSFFPKQVTRYWFIGFLNDGKKLEQIFAFTVSSIEEGKIKVNKQLETSGYDSNFLANHFKLCIGDNGEDKRTTIEKFRKKHFLQ